MKPILFSLVAVLTLGAAPAFAHTDAGSVSGLMAGLSHPLGGLDHVLAMIAVGLLAAQMGGRSIWTVPATFVGMLAVGGVLGVYGVPLPFVEQGILGSVIVLGFVVAFGGRVSPALALALAGGFAVFHGHAHGTEMPMDALGGLYGLGFVSASAVLHLMGIGTGLAVQSWIRAAAPLSLRFAGGGIAGAGVFLAVL